jgi:hypothetical protein
MVSQGSERDQIVIFTGSQAGALIRSQFGYQARNVKHRTLRNQADGPALKTRQWKLQIRGQTRDYAIDPLVQMLELLWPDPNRHDSSTAESSATE